MEINQDKVYQLKKGIEDKGPIVYWMSRDQRVHDNYTLLFAQNLAFQKNKSLAVIFNITPTFLNAEIRQYGFMIDGLKQTELELHKYNISFSLLAGDSVENILRFVKQIHAYLLVSDFDPLRVKRKWKESIAKKISIPFYEVDTHNIIPCRKASQKQEYGAYTFRAKIHDCLPEYLCEIPKLKQMKKSYLVDSSNNDWEKITGILNIKNDVKEVGWAAPGESASLLNLKYFLENKFDRYSLERNDPSKDSQSNLSPYLHFGQISAQRIALEVKKFGGNPESEKSFLEELIVRKELSDNFCFYNPVYDSFSAFPHWAKETLLKHKDDKREFKYSKDQFENAWTHDDLWNAAQIELVKTGKMHGYMRMYWAKKILEWSRNPQYALKISLYLNDKSELDGRDPNGYAGCAWAIGGMHDRPWPEREIFGKIRYMNRKGAEKKFDVQAYIRKFTS